MKGKVAIVTGGTSGLGKGIVNLLVNQGVKVAFCSRTEQKGKKLEKELLAKGAGVFYSSVNVREEIQIDRFIEEVIDKFGKIDILFNNAAVFPATPFLEIKREEWDFVLEINLRGVFLFGQKVAKHMVENRIEGKIVNISSAGGKRARLNLSHYCSSKAAVNMLTRVMALELAQYNINVNALCPGIIETEGVLNNIKNEEDIKNHKEHLKFIPLKRLPGIEEVAQHAIYLASGKASYITGETFYVDGGYTAGLYYSEEGINE